MGKKLFCEKQLRWSNVTKKFSVEVEKKGIHTLDVFRDISACAYGCTMCVHPYSSYRVFLISYVDMASKSTYNNNQNNNITTFITFELPQFL